MMVGYFYHFISGWTSFTGFITKACQLDMGFKRVREIAAMLIVIFVLPKQLV
jgi:hypothetical protein